MTRPRPRDPYAQVGAATRTAIEHAMPSLTLPEARVLLALVHQLTSWSRLEDTIALRQLMDITGMADESNTRKAVRGLEDRDALVRIPSPGRLASTYRLPTIGTAAETEPRSIQPGSPQPGSSQPGSPRALNPGPGDQRNPGPGDPLPEDVPRRSEITPLPPGAQPAAEPEPCTGQHANCRDCRTSPRALRVVPPPAPPAVPYVADHEDSAERADRLGVVWPDPPTAPA